MVPFETDLSPDFGTFQNNPLKGLNLLRLYLGVGVKMGVLPLFCVYPETKIASGKVICSGSG